MPARGHRQQPSVNGISFEEKVALWLAVDSENSYAESLSESSMIQLDGCRDGKRKLSGSSEHSAKRRRPSTLASSSQDSQSTHDRAVVFAAGMLEGPYLGHVIFDADVNKVYEIKSKEYNEKLDVDAKLSEEEKREAALTEEEKERLKDQAETVRAQVEEMMLLSGRDGFTGQKYVFGDLRPAMLKVKEMAPNVRFVEPEGSTGKIHHAFRDDTPYPAKGTDEEKKKWVEKVQQEAVPGTWIPDGLLVVDKADRSSAGIVIMEHKSDSGQADMNSKSVYATIALLKEIKVAGLLYLEPNGTYVMLASRNETECIECEFKWLNLFKKEDAQELCVLIGALMKYGQHHLRK